MSWLICGQYGITSQYQINLPQTCTTSGVSWARARSSRTVLRVLRQAFLTKSTQYIPIKKIMAPYIEAASVLRVDHDYILLQYIMEYSHARFQVDKYREHPASYRCSVPKGENN